MKDLSNATTSRIFAALVAIYVQGSLCAVAVTLFLGALGLEFSVSQWWTLVCWVPVVVTVFLVPDYMLMRRHFAPIEVAWSKLDKGEQPTSTEAVEALLRALNLPYLSFLRVSLYHGPLTVFGIVITSYLSNILFHSDYAFWQIWTFAAMVAFFAGPTHAVFEYFSVSRAIQPVTGRLHSVCGGLDPSHHSRLKVTGIQKKLLYLAIVITSLPLLFLAYSVLFKVGLIVDGLGVPLEARKLPELWRWVFGVVALCVTGAISLAVLTASEVSRSATVLINAMKKVESGQLDINLEISSTDEYAALFRGFNLMTTSLREELKILELSEDLMGELNLDVLLERIMRSTTTLLDADRSTLFLYDKKTNQLWSRFAEGLGSTEIRIPADAGVAGSVFISGITENIPDAHEHPKFSREVDKRTGYRTRSMLAMPVVNKAGERIGVTQVLNKKGGGVFTARDQARLAAFTAHISIALENAKLFEEVLQMKNYNESILRCTSNGIITLDDGQHFVVVNEAAASIIAQPAPNIVGMHAGELFCGPNQWVLASLQKAAESGQNDMAVDAELTFGDGHSASVNLTTLPLVDAKRGNIGSMIVLEDITDEKRVRSTMSRYLSKEVADQVLSSGDAMLAGREQRISVLFADLRNFTKSAEALGPRETVAMLNEYFSDMVEVIFENAGVLDKYIGDAIMALYGAPFTKEDDADRALRTANGMLRSVRELNRRRMNAGRSPVALGIGLNTGEAVLGSIGSPKRMEYTAIGDSVNLAARLESACKTYRALMLLTEYTVRDLKSPSRLRYIDLMRVKGKYQHVSIYESMDHHTEETLPNLDEFLKVYGCAVDAYRARDWRIASAAFTDALQIYPDDGPSQVLSERCHHFLETPPEDDWDGVWVLKEKH